MSQTKKEQRKEFATWVHYHENCDDPLDYCESDGRHEHDARELMKICKRSTPKKDGDMLQVLSEIRDVGRECVRTATYGGTFDSSRYAWKVTAIMDAYDAELLERGVKHDGN